MALCVNVTCRHENDARNTRLAAIPPRTRTQLACEFRCGLASVPRIPGPKNSTAQHRGRELPEFCRDREDAVLPFTTDTRVWPTNNISERHVRSIIPSRRYLAASPAKTPLRTGDIAPLSKTSQPLAEIGGRPEFAALLTFLEEGVDSELE